MANFDKKWSQLSKDESKAMKEKYGSRDAWQKAKSKAQTHQGGTAQPAAKSQYGEGTNWSKLTKSGKVSKDVRKDPRLQEMVKDPHTGEMKNKYAIKHSSGSIIRNPNINDVQGVKRVQKKEAQRAAERAPKQAAYEAREARRDSAEAYRQSRLDLQAAKAKHGPRGHYGMQSALENQSVAKVGQKYAHSGDLNERQADRNALVRTFQNSGYDYSHDEVQRSLNDGAYQQQNSWIYDQYGGGREGWKNWRDNYSIYGGENAHNREAFMAESRDDGNYTYDLGNFQGSQDIMAFDEVMEIGRNKQQAGRDFYNSQEFKDKYGQYDWAQDSSKY